MTGENYEKAIFIRIGVEFPFVGACSRFSECWRSYDVMMAIPVPRLFLECTPFFGEKISVRISGIDTPEIRGEVWCGKSQSPRRKRFSARPDRKSRASGLGWMRQGQVFPDRVYDAAGWRKRRRYHDRRRACPSLWWWQARILVSSILIWRNHYEKVNILRNLYIDRFQFKHLGLRRSHCKIWWESHSKKRWRIFHWRMELRSISLEDVSLMSKQLGMAFAFKIGWIRSTFWLEKTGTFVATPHTRLKKKPANRILNINFLQLEGFIGLKSIWCKCYCRCPQILFNPNLYRTMWSALLLDCLHYRCESQSQKLRFSSIVFHNFSSHNCIWTVHSCWDFYYLDWLVVTVKNWLIVVLSHPSSFLRHRSGRALLTHPAPASSQTLKRWFGYGWVI